MSSNIPKVKIRRVRLWMWIAVVAPVVICICGATYLGWAELQASWTYQKRIAQLGDERLPVDNATSANWYQQHSYPEGVEQWTAIVEMLKRNVGFNHLPILGMRDLPQNLDPSTPWSDFENIENYLNDTRIIREEIKSAIQAPVPVQFPIRFDGMRTLLPFVQDSRTVHRYLQLDFEAACYSGESKRALEDLQLMDGVAKAFELPLFMVSRMVTIALNSSRDHCVLRSMRAGLWSDKELEELQSMLAVSHYSNEKLQNALLGERVFGIDFLENGVDIQPNLNLGMFITPRQKIDILAHYDELDELARTPIDRVTDAAKILESRFVSVRNRTRNHFAIQILPALSAIIHAEVRTENTRKWVRTAVGLRLYKSKFGHWPEQLSALSEIGYSSTDYLTVNFDPFGYEVEDGIAYLWSLSDKNAERISDERPTRKTTDGNLKDNEPIPNLIELKQPNLQ